jgi:hypothetical protein
MKHLRNTAIVIGLTVYVVAFYLAPLRNLADPITHFTPLRLQTIVPLALCPDETLLPTWFGPTRQFSVLDRVPVLLAAGLILAWAAALGWLLLAALRLDRILTRLETAVFSTAVGLNVLSTWALLMGLSGRLERTWLITVPALLTFAAAAGLCYRRQHSDTVSREPTAGGSGKTSNAELMDSRWLWLGLPFVAAIFLAAMLPPLDFDVCEYHLQAPKEFFLQGRITFLPHNVYANMALGAEMLSLLGMTLAGDWWWGALIGKTVIAAFAPLCALGLLAAGRRFYSNSAGVVAALIYISIPWIVSISGLGLVEGASACFLFLALYALLLSFQSGGGSSAFVALSGYLAGGAVATKYPAVLFVLIPLAVWIVVGRYRREQAQEAPSPRVKTPEPPESLRFHAAFRSLLVFLLAAAIGCGLWFAKNWAFTGNPTYPLLYSAFDGKTWNADKERQWNRVHRPHDFSVETLGRDLCGVALTSEGLSPLVMPLALLAFVSTFAAAALRRLRWELCIYAAFVIATWWLFTHRIDRFWVPVLPVLALLAGAGACWNAEVWWRRSLKGLLLVGCAANFLVATAGPNNAWFIPLEQLRYDTQWITPWHWYLNNDATGATVLAVGDAAVFDLKSPVLYNTCFDDCIFEQLVKGKTADEIRAEFAARHIDYVYVNWGEIGRYRDSYGFTDFVQPEVFDRLVKQGILHLIPASAELSGAMYRVTPPK